MAAAEKVCIVTDAQLHLQTSGLSQVAWRHALGLSEHGWEVHLVCPVQTVAPLDKSAPRTLSVHQFRCSRANPIKDLGAGARRLAMDFGIPLVIAHGLSGSRLFSGRAHADRTFRAVAYIHHSIAGETSALVRHNLLFADGFYPNLWRLRALAQEWALARSEVDKYLVPSRFTARELVRLYGLPLGCITVVPNGVDTAVFRPRRNRDMTGPPGDSTGVRQILFVGRLEGRKGVTTLIDAFAMVKQRSRDVRLVIVGNGPARSLIERRAARFGIGADLAMIQGLSPDRLAQCYRQADLVVVPSVYEGFGLVLLEALASGARVLPASIAPFKEIAKGFPCKFVAPADPMELARGIEDELKSSAEWSPQEQAYQELSARYAWQFVTDKLASALREMSKGV